MNPISRYQTKRFILLFFLIWVIFNHSVRMLSGPAAVGTFEDLTGAFPTNTGEALSSVNAVRLLAGKKVRGVDYICPQAIHKFCAVTADSVVMILGLSP